jgi:protease IV
MGKGIAFVILMVAFSSVMCSCAGLRFCIEGGGEDPLREYVIQGKEKEKILVIPIRGFISDSPRRHLLGERPSVVHEIVSRLKKAEKDDRIKAVVLEIDSAGGTTTAGDILYHEIMEFKNRRKVKIVAIVIDVAASGGYYVALPADRILAHPTSIVGSIGAIIITPKVIGLMDKLGVAVDVKKSGKEKDMGSPFRPSTLEEQRIFQGMTEKMAGRFLDLVVKHRKLDESGISSSATARIYLADEALRLGLIDRVGHLDDAISEAMEQAGLPKEAKVVVYRRTKYPDDTLYNTSLSWYEGTTAILSDGIPSLRPGFYYLWLPGVTGN